MDRGLFTVNSLQLLLCCVHTALWDVLIILFQQWSVTQSVSQCKLKKQKKKKTKSKTGKRALVVL